MTAARRICRGCGDVTPINAPSCIHCGARSRSDLGWKVPLIVGMFAAALTISVLIRVFATM